MDLLTVIRSHRAVKTASRTLEPLPHGKRTIQGIIISAAAAKHEHKYQT
jgi:nitroreductase